MRYFHTYFLIIPPPSGADLSISILQKQELQLRDTEASLPAPSKWSVYYS